MVECVCMCNKYVIAFDCNSGIGMYMWVCAIYAITVWLLAPYEMRFLFSYVCYCYFGVT